LVLTRFVPPFVATDLALARLLLPVSSTLLKCCF
jgi:hypothetical protein